MIYSPIDEQLFNDIVELLYLIYNPEADPFELGYEETDPLGTWIRYDGKIV